MDFEINFETGERPFFKGHHDLFVYHDFFLLYSNPLFFTYIFFHYLLFLGVYKCPLMKSPKPIMSGPSLDV